MIKALGPRRGQPRQIGSRKGTVRPLITRPNGDFRGWIPGRPERYAGINLGAAIGHIRVDGPTQSDVDGREIRQVALVCQQAAGTAKRFAILLNPARIAYRAIEARQSSRDVLCRCLYGSLIVSRRQNELFAIEVSMQKDSVNSGRQLRHSDVAQSLVNRLFSQAQMRITRPR